MHHRKRERRVGPRSHEDHLMGERRGLGPSNIDNHDPCAAPLRDLDMPQRIGLTDRIGAPQDHHLGVVAQILLGRGLERAGHAESESAQPPTDHRRVPVLASIKIGKALHLCPLQAEPVIIGEISVALPKPDAVPPDRAHTCRDLIESVVPESFRPKHLAACRADERGKQPAIIADDLMGGLAAHAQEALAVGVGFIACNRNEVPIIDRDGHAAQRRVTVHRAHGLERVQAGRFQSDCSAHLAEATPECQTRKG